MSILTASNLTVIRDNQTVVNHVTLSLNAGEILGLIGPNGAGKSSTVGGLLGIHPIADGTITMGEWEVKKGQEVPAAMKQRIAYIPEQPLYYPDLTLAEHLDWKMRLWRMAKLEPSKQRLDDLVESFQLGIHLDKFPHQCSKGTLQKLMVVSAFLFPFDVLIVDEPFVGLDVIAIRQLKQYLEAARQQGAAILLSTHVLDSAERMCQRFAFLMDGEVFAEGSLEDLRQQHGDTDATLEDLFVSMFEQKRGIAL